MKVLLAGLAGAAIDAVYFSTLAITGGHSPGRTLQSIASFWLGPKSLDLGTSSMLLGASTHIALATIMAAGFAVFAWRLPVLQNSPIRAGTIYGGLLYSLMYLVVLPLRWPSIFPRWDGWRSVGDVSVHIVIGICFAFVIGGHVSTVTVRK